ncbi:MAG: hypothetical protein ACUVTU_11610 [Desulfurispora sp.]|uniref:hypothetical protein n=1 Tax=Desulfurispora sp. TaxID=3014275 RepID=UPI0040493A5E
MSTSYQFDHLVLLVGTNPLPNYIVAKYFILNNNSPFQIHLICSRRNESIGQQGTLNIAQNLKNVLTKEFPEQIIKLSVELNDASDAQSIFQDMGKLDSFLQNHNSSWHLNYTGGTKSMAVHVHRYMNQRKDQLRSLTFSYLDSRSMQLKFDDSTLHAPVDMLHPQLNIELDSLLLLHGYQKVGDYRLPKESEVWGCIEKTQRAQLYEYKLKYLAQDQNPELEEVKNYISNHFSGALSVDINCLAESLTKHGFWLEWYIYDTLEKLKELSSYKDLYQLHINIKAIKAPQNDIISGNTGIKEKEFEIDVLLLKGYQLWNISCGKNDEKELKYKAIEAIHRAMQMGGEEARAVLACLLNGKRRDAFKNDIVNITGNISGNFELIDVVDLTQPGQLEKILQQLIF